MIIYRTTNLINGKFYVGKDEHDNPTYLGSGIILKHAIAKYGRENFVKEELEQCDVDVLDSREKHWIAKLKPPYNIAAGGEGGYTLKYAGERRLQQWKRRISKAGRGRKHSKESIEKMRASKKGTIFTAEHRRNLSKAHKGLPANNKGIPMSDAQRAKVLIDVECPHCGKVGQRRAMGRWHFDNCTKGRL